MAVTASIVGVSQDMNLDDGTMASFIQLRLANGVLIRALISDDVAQTVIGLFVQGQEAFAAAPCPPEAPVSIDEALETHVFDDARCPARSIAPAPAPAPPAARKPMQVTTDELGYPVVHGTGGVDPARVLGDHEPDEDGVGGI